MKYGGQTENLTYARPSNSGRLICQGSQKIGQGHNKSQIIETAQ